MIHIPSLTHEQLELLRLTKKDSVEELQLFYEFPIVDDNNKPPIVHPSLIQELIDNHLIQVREIEASMLASEFQQLNWSEYCEDLDYPTQVDWDQWRQGFIAQLGEGVEQLMNPGKGLGQFTKVWIREIRVRAVQPSNL
ncbi:hypothetical protein HRE53_27915 (plasmid) [Acaryochloris sp. 'Moss Beach']|uniref:hypothetical protein n=1 Tax=Acaryochloris TaxID=155977 RepID=UPI001BB0D505|nr:MULTISPECIES: hypothetical protein [Acaryochloris]QUY45988.1 hypothetical protein I1H34_30140 [Acaryochloris marina S15]UJB72651.1 hypothetical protein HRE53_27915 [Acaryochloris sp. 'Moss Beach']